ncbi:Stk1 family PASTA domain-containing Ser/Thr kinase [soil metagenome]
MAEDLLGTTIVGKYRVNSLTLRSETGDLYAATHVLTERPLGLRVLPGVRSSKMDAAARFFDSARASAKFIHINALNLADFGTDEKGNSYAVCDDVSGETLKATILRDGQMSSAATVGVAKQIAAALSEAHSAGVVHGNLSAENILLTEPDDTEATAKVFDFATLNAIERSGDVIEARASDFSYLAPEQCAGGEVADARGDVYSLGVIIYEMLAGVVPFTGEKPTDVMLKHIEEPPAPMSVFRDDIDPELEKIYLKAMSKNPEMRQQSAQEIIDELSAYSGGVPTAATAAAQGGNFWRTAFMVLIGTAALASALIYATSVQRTEPTTVLQPDANGLPVQPINPATGIEEQALASMPTYATDSLDATGQPLTAPDTLPGGDSYNPWATGVPPPGAPPQYIPPGGQVYTIDPNNPSQFMPNEGGVILVPIPANTNTNVKPTPSPRSTEANTNTAAPTTPAATPAATPRQSPAQAKPSPSRPVPAKTPDDNGEGDSDQ